MKPLTAQQSLTCRNWAGPDNYQGASSQYENFFHNNYKILILIMQSLRDQKSSVNHRSPKGVSENAIANGAMIMLSAGGFHTSLESPHIELLASLCQSTRSAPVSGMMKITLTEFPASPSI